MIKIIKNQEEFSKIPNRENIKIVVWNYFNPPSYQKIVYVKRYKTIGEDHLGLCIND